MVPSKPLIMNTCNDVIIRKARFEDLETIVWLIANDDLGKQRENPISPLPESYIHAFEQIRNDPNQFLAVAEFDGQIVGTLQLSYIPYMTYGGSLVAQLEAVHVSKDFRDKKIGTTMMNWAIEQAKQKGCHRMQLTSNKLRINAHRFYERLGFKTSHEGMKLFL